MNFVLRELTAWLWDYYAATAVLLLIVSLTQACVRQPVQRMVVSWVSLVGLAALMVLCALPTLPRLALRSTRPAMSTPLPRISQTATASHVQMIQRPLRPQLPSVSKPVAFPITPSKSNPDVPVSSRSPVIRWPASEYWGTLIFLSGAIAVMAWEVIGMLQIRKLCSGAVRAPAFAQDELVGLLTTGVRAPRLLVSPRITVAVALGIWRPTIVLPAYAVETVERTRLRSLLAHEWAHLRRGDLWLLGMARLLLIVLYAQPLFWWLRHRIRIDQELLADAAAAEMCGPQTYAESLVIWARRQPQVPSRLIGAVGIWESPGQLTRRIAMLLDERNRIGTQTTRHWYWGTGLTTLAIVTGLSLLTLEPARLARATEPPVIAAQGSPVPASGAVLTEQSALQNLPASKRGVLAIDGVCLDEQKQPLAGVRLRLVFVNHDDGSQQELQSVQSDAQGRFHFAAINTGKLFATFPAWQNLLTPSNRKLLVFAQSPGRATMKRSMWKKKSGTQSYEFILPPAASLVGRIVDEQDRPVAGATVLVNSSTIRALPGIHTAVTDVDGRYEIADLAPWDKDAEDIARRKSREATSEEVQRDLYTRGHGLIQHPDFANRSFVFRSVPFSHDFTLSHPALIEGQITFQETGRPAAKVRVTITRNSEDNIDGHSVAYTDDQGRYATSDKLVPGRYIVNAQLDGWPSVVLEGMLFKAGKNQADIRLEKGGIIQLKVMEISTGQPVVMSPGALTFIHAMHLTTKSENYNVLDADGTCTISVPAGRTALMVSDMFPLAKNGVTDQRHRWMLVGNERRAYHLIDLAKGETKQVELRLMKSTALNQDSVMEYIDDDHEYGDQISQLVKPAADTTPPAGQPHRNVGEAAAIAAVRELGGWVKTEAIDGVDCVVEVNMGFTKLATNPEEESVENKLFTDEALFYLPKFPQLKTLSLNRGQATDQGLEHLRGMKNIESVCLTDAWGITDAGIAHLATLPKLVRFCCSRTEQLTDDSLRHLGQAANLQSVFICDGRFSNLGLQHLKGLKHLTELELDSSVPLMTDAGLQELAGHVELEQLCLTNTAITDAGLQHLHGLKKLTQLTLTGSHVTPAGLAELRQMLPKLKTSDQVANEHAAQPD